MIEAKVVAAVQQVLTGGKIEDDRVECKAELMPPDQVRQLAAAANAALGDDILWIVGLDEKAQRLVPLDTQVDLANWWAQVERNFDDGVAPQLLSIRVPVAAGSVLALHFQTDRAPYVVKTTKGGSPEREVPWRDGSRTRSAKRHELLRLLIPSATVPNVQVINCTAEITSNAEGRLLFNGQIEFYVEHITDTLVAVPAHTMSGAVTVMNGTHPLIVVPDRSYVDTPSRETRSDGLYCHGPGVCALAFSGDIGAVEGDTPEELRDLTHATVEISAPVVGSAGILHFIEKLGSLFDRSEGPTMRVPMRAIV